MYISYSSKCYLEFVFIKFAKNSKIVDYWKIFIFIFLFRMLKSINLYRNIMQKSKSNFYAGIIFSEAVKSSRTDDFIENCGSCRFCLKC